MSVYYGEDTTTSRERRVAPAIVIARAQNLPVPADVTAQSANKEYKGQVQTQADEVPSLVLQESMTSPMAPIDDEQASYRRALNFLTANEPERRLDICLSYRTFQALEKLAYVLYGDAKYMTTDKEPLLSIELTCSRYPRVEYDSSGSRLTIYTAPSALHGASAAALQQGIVNSVRDGLIRHHKQELFRYIQPIGESTYNSVDE
jgi:hypothetical protein